MTSRKKPQLKKACKTRSRRVSFTVTALLVLFPAMTPLVQGQEQGASAGPTLVTRFVATGTGPEQLAEVVTESLELTLRLAGVEQVERADYLLPTEAPRASIRYYERRRAAGAVYGAVRRNDTGGYAIQAGIWSPEKEGFSRFEQEIESVFAVFDIADELALDIASEVVGRELSFGTLAIENTRHLEEFGVYVDGQLVARNERRVQVVAGERAVSVTRSGPLGDQPVAEFNVSVPAEGRVSVALDPPEEPAAATNEEADVPEGLAGSDGSDTAQTAQSASDRPQEVPTGSLVVESSPPGATVLLDNEAIGTTPLRTFGVESGRYELVLQRPLFHDSVAAVDVVENQRASLEQELRVNEEAPAIQRHLIRPLAPGAASLSVTALKAGYLAGSALASTQFFTEALKHGDPLLAAMDLIVLNSLYGGSLVAHETPGRRVMSWTGMGLVALGPVVSIAADEIGGSATGLEDEWDEVLEILPFVQVIGSMALGIVDVALTPAAAQRRNEELLEAVRETGTVPELRELRPRRLVMEGGAGGVARLGYVGEVFAPYGRIEAAAGTGFVAGSDLGFTPVASVRAAARPLAEFAPGIHPEVSVLVQGETDFRELGVSVGGAFGAVFSFERFELFWRSNYLYGIRSRRDRFVSSFGVSL